MKLDLARDLRQLLDTHDDPVVLIDDRYAIVAANGAYLASYGVSEAALVGRKCHEVSHDSAVPCHERGEDCPLLRSRATGGPIDTLHVHFDGRRAPERVRVRGTPVTIGDRRLLVERIERIDARRTGTGVVSRMVGRSPAFLSMLQRLIQGAALPGSVLLQGESGVGKELAARFVHEHSARASGPFVVVDCASIPEALFEAELFGHERGAFTGSHQARSGLFEAADHGTLFLDEIGELPQTLQSKLLRAIDAGEIRRIGARHAQRVDVRIVAATNRDLHAMVGEGAFRLDLFYRLATHEIRIPALRERRDDIEPIARALLAAFEPLRTPRLSDDAVAYLREQPFPGNIRELANVLQRALAFGPSIDARVLRAAETRAPGTAPSRGRPPMADARTNGGAPSGMRPARGLEQRPLAGERGLREAKLELLVGSLARHEGNRARAARELGVSERTVYRWMRHFCSDPACRR